ncbi:hypothetical protein CC80DRAFT_565302 [Byssothecium circinans]|uniref:Uncharacterized protein n=1 Tax=Byssothecium circinans TaxID=147558 RepID=A0A6A5UDL2_9PLEO|nr:hypothetical protein CC80DRAFT_565302 [Byssothecium circinans]
MFSRFTSKKQASANPVENSMTDQQDLTPRPDSRNSEYDKTPTQSNHFSSSDGWSIVSSATSVGASFTLISERSMEEVQLEAEVNKALCQEMQADLQELHKAYELNKTMLKAAHSDLENAREEAKAHAEISKKAQSSFEALQMTADVNLELLEDCKISLGAKEEKVVMLTARLEKCNERLECQERQISTLKDIIKAQADEISAHLDPIPQMDFTGLVDPQLARDTQVLEQEKAVLLGKIESINAERSSQAFETKKLNDEISELREQLSHSEAKAENAKKQLVACEKRYKELYWQKDLTEKDLDYEQTCNRDLQKRLDDPTANAAYKEAMLHAARNGGHDGHSAFGTTIRNYDDVKTISELRVKLARSEDRFDRAEAHILTQKANIEELSRVLADDKVIMKKAKSRRGGLYREAERNQNKISKLESEVTSLKEYAHSAEIKIAEQGRLIQQFRKQFADFTKVCGTTGPFTQDDLYKAVQMERDECLKLEVRLTQRDEQIADLEGKLSAEKAKGNNSPSQSQQRHSLAQQPDDQIAELKAKLNAEKAKGNQSSSQDQQRHSQIREREDQITSLKAKLNAEKEKANQLASQAQPGQSQSFNLEHLDALLNECIDTIAQLMDKLESERIFADERLNEAKEKHKVGLDLQEDRIRQCHDHIREIEGKLHSEQQSSKDSCLERDAKIARLEDDLHRARQEQPSPQPSTPQVIITRQPSIFNLEREIEQRLRAQISRELEAKHAAKVGDLQHQLTSHRTQLADAQSQVLRREENLTDTQKKLEVAEGCATRQAKAAEKLEAEKRQEVKVIERKSATIDELTARLLGLGLEVEFSEEDA